MSTNTPAPPEPVDRCVCLDITFASLIETARREGLDFAALKARTRCSTGCGLCEPYVKLSLATGKDRWPVMSETQTRIMLNQLKPT